MENIRNRVNTRLTSNEKDFLKWTSKPIYMPQLFDNGLVTRRKIKFTLALNKPAFVEVFIIDLSKVLMFKFYNDSIENNGNNTRL